MSGYAYGFGTGADEYVLVVSGDEAGQVYGAACGYPTITTVCAATGCGGTCTKNANIQVSGANKKTGYKQGGDPICDIDNPNCKDSCHAALDVSATCTAN